MIFSHNRLLEQSTAHRELMHPSFITATVPSNCMHRQRLDQAFISVSNLQLSITLDRAETFFQPRFLSISSS